MPSLPPIPELISRCKALAALDVILSPEWESRYYSFNANWSEAKGDEQQMASMRDGCGNEWWIVFHRSGWTAMKGAALDTPAWRRHGEALSAALQRSFPPEPGFRNFCAEPAFRWEATTFAYFHPAPGNDAKGQWTRVNNIIPREFADEDPGDEDLLCHLTGRPADYATFASDYYEIDNVDESYVAQIFALQPITETTVRALNPSISLEDIANELYGEIQYPRASNFAAEG